MCDRERSCAGATGIEQCSVRGFPLQHAIGISTAELAYYARLMQSLHFPLTPRGVRVEAERVLHACSEAACKANKTLGPDWYTKVFLEDNPEMRSKHGKGYD